MKLIKPLKLNTGDAVATISPCWGAAGESDVVWKYNIGKSRLEKMGLKVIPAPNSMRGEDYLQKNLSARAEDILWAFENKNIKGIIANIGGNDSHKVLPYLNMKSIACNPKIFIGYSDVMNFHLYCYKAGLSTFYGHNLLPIIAETPYFHPYSAYWFKKVLFNNEVIGEIHSAETFSCDENNYFDVNYRKSYFTETGYLFVHGKGIVQGRLLGGHTGLMTCDFISPEDFFNKILFIEDIAEFFTPELFGDFISWLAENGILHRLKGMLIGKLCAYRSFDEYKTVLNKIISDKYGLDDFPVVANMNFGHTSPICILPYGAMTEIDCENKRVSVLESGVI